jgi:asparagine synthase (glutamine-hydrolysing)
MPGLFGIISCIPRKTAECELRKMLGAVCHEDFYVTGTWTDESLGLYVGWVARKGSFADGMPVRNEHGDVTLIFAGEDFPEPGIQSRLRERGHLFEGASPSYLVHLYEEEPSFPRNLNGRFHGLVVDSRRRNALLFNDRYGMQRLYYSHSKDAFYFASEAKSILAVRPELRSLDSRGLGEFISCGAVLENRSLFPGIEVLPPGSAWIFQDGELQKKSSYFQPTEWEEQGTLDEPSFYTEFREAFTRNLPRYLGGSEPVAMSLTGGLDTRMIMAWQRAQSGTLPCYTFGSMLHENQDVRVARRVAQTCHQPFQVIAAGEEFLSQFAHYAERAIHLSDGCVDISRSPDVYVNEKARQIAPVRLTGNYGGELLRQVRTFKPSDPLPGLYCEEVLSQVRRARETFDGSSQGHPVSYAVFKQCPWNHYGILAVEESRLALRSPFLDNDVVKAVFRAPSEVPTTNTTSLRLISDGSKELAKIPTDRGLGGTRTAIWDIARRAFLEFQFKAEYAYDMGMPQWVARADHALSPFHLERLFLGRHKVFHFRIWYRDALAGYIREMLLDSRSLARPYVERKGLEKIVTGHLKGHQNYTNEIHKVLSLEILSRLFLDDAGKQREREPPNAVPASVISRY